MSAHPTSRQPVPVVVERDEKALARELAGDSASQRGDSTEALSCWREALEILEERNSCAAAARVACKMAALEESSGHLEAACAHYTQAADWCRLAGEVHRVPMYLNNLAMLRKIAGELEEAAGIFRRALDEAAQCHGEMHAETALIAGNLGAVLCESDDLLGAEQMHMQSLHIREHLYGPAHPDVGLVLGHLGVVHQMRGDADKAQRHYEAALTILDEFPGLHEAERQVLRANLEEL
ncbi:MAG: tetratricopeptide repeat protein [Chthoniobacterales bacterium]|nr:tetratricopeptide repeat protein [Chthoniobacterales bacterium]